MIRENARSYPSKLVRELSRPKKFRKLQLPVDPTVRQLLLRASLVYKDERTFAGLLRRIIVDWWHYRKAYLDLGRELKEELQGLKEELKTLKEELRSSTR